MNERKLDHEYVAEFRAMGSVHRHPGIWVAAVADEGITDEFLEWHRSRLIPFYMEVQEIEGVVECFLCVLIFDNDTAFEWRMCWT